MTQKDQDALLDSLLDGDISEADFLRLEAEMHVDPEVRQAYYERLKLETTLEIEAESQAHDSSDSLSTGHRSPTKSESLGWLGWAAAAVLAILVAVLGWEIHETNQSIAGTEAESIASGFGVVAEQSNVDWNLNRGDLLPQGTIQLGAGIANLELFSGVTLIIEAPADFEITSANKVIAKQGKYFVSVPRIVRNFRIQTEGGEVFDVEQKLALSVPPAGKAIVLEGNSSLQKQMVNRRNERLQAWENHTAELRRDPHLLGYFPMNQTTDWDRQLIDESAGKRNGTIVRALRSPDRWGRADQGLDFSPTGSRVRIEIPGDHQSLTLMCWAKIDSLDRLYNSLFLTDGHELHEPHWQIMNDGRLFFSVKANEPAKKGDDKHIAFSPPIWTPAESGKWMHIATVFDGAAMTTTHFINGEKISHDKIPKDLQPEKVRIGAASIGNWSDPTRGDDPNFAVRNLNGTIDEFAIFKEPLSADEIEEIYEVGKP